jgi:hypothetical protein
MGTPLPLPTAPLPRTRAPRPFRSIRIASCPRACAASHGSWAPRRKTAASKDFFDTQDVKAKAFAIDWDLASARQQLGKKLQRAADKLDPPDPDALGTCYGAMQQYAEMVLQAFTFYSSQGSHNDIVSITRNSYLQFLRDLSLVNNEAKGQRDSDLQLIFESANASATKEDTFNHSKELNRSEWVGCLVQLILARYVTPQNMPIAEAVRRFFESDLRLGAHPDCFQDSDVFRAGFCYLEEVDVVLRVYEPSLRHIYTSYAFGSGAVGDAVLSTKLMDYDEYHQLVTQLEITDPFVTLREIRLAFLWSRMLVVDENSQKQRMRLLQLDFTDFLEVLVRIAYQMALPTDKDLFDLGVAHAGEYLEYLEGYPEEEATFKRERTRDIGQPLDQPIGQKVRHFCEWLLYRVRGGAATNGDGKPQAIDKKQAEKFVQGQVPRVKRAALEEEEEATTSPEGKKGSPRAP